MSNPKNPSTKAWSPKGTNEATVDRLSAPGCSKSSGWVRRTSFTFADALERAEKAEARVAELEAALIEEPDCRCPDDWPTPEESASRQRPNEEKPDTFDEVDRMIVDQSPRTKNVRSCLDIFRDAGKVGTGESLSCVCLGCPKHDPENSWPIHRRTNEAPSRGVSDPADYVCSVCDVLTEATSLVGFCEKHHPRHAQRADYPTNDAKAWASLVTERDAAREEAAEFKRMLWEERSRHDAKTTTLMRDMYERTCAVLDEAGFPGLVGQRVQTLEDRVRGLARRCSETAKVATVPEDGPIIQVPERQWEALQKAAEEARAMLREWEARGYVSPDTRSLRAALSAVPTGTVDGETKK